MGFAALMLMAMASLAEGASRVVPPPGAAAGAWSEGDAPARGILLDGSPWFLWELRPGVHVEQGVTVSVNSLGLRGPEPGPKIGPRLLALGDSSIYGFGVGDDEVFTARLGSALGADVVNAGVPGYSTFQSLNLLDARGLGLDPDLVLVGNLWSDNHFDTFVDRELLAACTDWRGSRIQRLRAILEGSALFRWVDWGLRVRDQAALARRVGWTVGSAGDPTGRRRVAIEDYAANLDAMAERLGRRGAAVAFVLLANRDDLERRTPHPAWEPYRDVMRETAARWGAPLIDVPAAFVASGLGPDALFLDAMHPTAAGHGLLATAVVAGLNGWPLAPIYLRKPGPRPGWTDPFLNMEPPTRD